MSYKYNAHQRNAHINQVRRLIKTAGKPIEFQRPVLNEFNEPSGETESFELMGVFHETASHVSRSSTEGTTSRTKPAPMILVMTEDADQVHIKDIVHVNDNLYFVSEVKNIAEGDFACDISLEEVLDDGKRFQP